MISPELLRRYPFFGSLADEKIKSLAMIAEEKTINKGAVICEEGKPADSLFLLITGGISLYYVSEDEYQKKSRKEFLVGEINPGEVFAISALIEPFIYTTTVIADKDSQVLKFDSEALHQLIKNDPKLDCVLMKKIAAALMERLTFARVQLAAAWAK